MNKIRETLITVLVAFRHADDENELPRFDTAVESAISAMEATPDIYHEAILKGVLCFPFKTEE